MANTITQKDRVTKQAIDIFYTPLPTPTRCESFFDTYIHAVIHNAEDSTKINGFFDDRLITTLYSNDELVDEGSRHSQETAPLNISSASSDDESSAPSNVDAVPVHTGATDFKEPTAPKMAAQVVVSSEKQVVYPEILRICDQLDLILKNKSSSFQQVIHSMNALAKQMHLTDFSASDRFLEIGSKIASFIVVNKAKLENLSFRGFSEIIHAFERLGYRDENLFCEVFGSLINKTKHGEFSEMTFHDAANILHAFASLNIFDDNVFKKLSKVILNKCKSTVFLEKQMVDRATLNSISSILWAYACCKTHTNDDTYKTVVETLLDKYKSQVFMAGGGDFTRIMQAKIVYDLPLKKDEIDRYDKDKQEIEVSYQNHSEKTIQRLAQKYLGIEFKRGTPLKLSHHIPDLLDANKGTVLEFDGPFHFIKNGEGTNHVNGSTQLRDFMIQTKDKMKLVTIPWFEWASKANRAQQIQYLESRL